MRLATLRAGDETRAVKLAASAAGEGDQVLVDLGAPDVGTFLARDDWRGDAESANAATRRTYDVAGADFAPLVPHPSKIICVGLNYRNHIQEMGRDLPEHPTLFAKFADSLIGAHDAIIRPSETEELDWEVELAVVIGAPARRVIGVQAERVIAGFTVLNDVTCRDWQFRTREWLQGKTWESTTPVGPYLVTPDDLPGGARPTVSVTLSVDGEVMQRADTADLLFDPIALVEYVSTIVRLNPGDLIATGTPGGVGHARNPQRFLAGGELVVAEVEGIGRLENLVVNEATR